MSTLGYAIGTRSSPNTANEFYFWIPPEEASLQIGSIVKVESPENRVMGVVEEMKSYLDVDDFLTHALPRGNDPLLTPANREQSIIVCKARVLLQQVERPIKEGIVRYPTREELEEVFNVEGCNLPFGVFVNTDTTMLAVKVHEEYVLGYEGAHVNISGMSGLATKTSTFLFLLASIFTHADSRVACVIFNNKSDDLLYIDEASTELTQEDLLIYGECGISPRGFNARFFAPSNFYGRPHSLRQSAEVFRWGWEEIVEYIPSLLKAATQDQKEKLDNAFYELRRMTAEQGIDSLTELLEFMRRELLREDKGWAELVRGTYKATWGKLYNQLRGLETKYDGLITGYADEVVDIPFDSIADREVWVIDIQQLGFYPRKLIFERIIDEFLSRLERRSLKVDKLIIFMDELNKYAPSNASAEVASLKEKLVDIAARGRSVGISLFGAEQFKSKIDQNILGNISTDIYGKTKDAELAEPLYKNLRDEVKGRIRRFSRGEKLLDHELFETPVFIRVPRPPCMLGSERARLRAMQKNIA
ncbi:ATP-binding protein [Candidatus Pyrohabitans sp.]